jgi:hypothetical protein
MTVTFVEIQGINGITEHAIIDHGNGEFTSMLKLTYEAKQAELIKRNLVDAGE